MKAVYALSLALCLASATVQAAADPAAELQLDPVPAGKSSQGREVRGVLRAVDQAMLSSELNGRVLEIPFREGESFKAGDLLVRFDCGAYQAQLNASQAAMRAAQQELSQNRQLESMKSVGRNAVALAEAKLAQAAAESQVYQIQTSRCRIVAPFAGQVVTRKVQQFEYVAQGTPLLEIVNNRNLEINLLVPSRWLTRLKPGAHFTFTPDETGQPLQAEVTRVGARIDESSQTLTLTGRVTGVETGLLAGMSGSARFGELP